MCPRAILDPQADGTVEFRATLFAVIRTSLKIKMDGPIGQATIHTYNEDVNWPSQTPAFVHKCLSLFPSLDQCNLELRDIMAKIWKRTPEKVWSAPWAYISPRNCKFTLIFTHPGNVLVVNLKAGACSFLLDTFSQRNVVCYLKYSAGFSLQPYQFSQGNVFIKIFTKRKLVPYLTFSKKEECSVLLDTFSQWTVTADLIQWTIVSCIE